MDDEYAKANARIHAAVAADVPHLYFNSCVCLGNGRDILLALELNRVPVATVNVPLTEAKTLAATLAGYIKAFEQRTGREIVTVAELAALAQQDGTDD